MELSLVEVQPYQIETHEQEKKVLPDRGGACGVVVGGLHAYNVIMIPS